MPNYRNYKNYNKKVKRIPYYLYQTLKRRRARARVTRSALKYVGGSFNKQQSFDIRKYAGINAHKPKYYGKKRTFKKIVKKPKNYKYSVMNIKRFNKSVRIPRMTPFTKHSRYPWTNTSKGTFRVRNKNYREHHQKRINDWKRHTIYNTVPLLRKKSIRRKKDIFYV